MEKHGLRGDPTHQLVKIRFRLALLALGAALLLSPQRLAPGRAAPAQVVAMRELVPSLNWADWYAAASGFTPDPTYFGAYVAQAADDDLYLGLGTARPAENGGTGALLARFDGQTLTSLGTLDEEGVHDMHRTGDTLHIAGTDPCCGDDWSAGNHYTYTHPGPLVKHRDPVHGLGGVLHTWGLWQGPGTDLFAAVSSDHGGARTGEVFSSPDQGQTWAILSPLGGYRVYDIIGFEGHLFALYVDALNDPLHMAFSNDGGVHWGPVFAGDLHRFRLQEFQSRLLAVSFDRRAIYTLANWTVDRYDLPAGVRIGFTDTDGRNYNYNVLAVAEGNLYTILEVDQGAGLRYVVARTRDLVSWEAVAVSDRPLISLAYWPARRSLVASEQGAGAALWEIPYLHRIYLPVVSK